MKFSFDNFMMVTLALVSVLIFTILVFWGTIILADVWWMSAQNLYNFDYAFKQVTFHLTAIFTTSVLMLVILFSVYGAISMLFDIFGKDAQTKRKYTPMLW